MPILEMKAKKDVKMIKSARTEKLSWQLLKLSFYLKIFSDSFFHVHDCIIKLISNVILFDRHCTEAGSDTIWVRTVEMAVYSVIVMPGKVC